ncbi:YggS family pyridoxal phosphate-dependent enzyme [Inhella sp.]|uniref:YggS family pyridoxal phosphate-dependent enzyme n=1 Tax=Inhella sp. TaxID=1921806 RepID=UPI0035AE529D
MAIPPELSDPRFSDLPARLQTVHARMDEACALYGRPAGTVQLLCVSKTQPAAAIRAAHALGERHFGENYVQEALDKMAELADLRPPPIWHLIGPLQANKTRVVAEAFDWVHSVDRLRIAERLSSQRPAGRAPLQVCLQVNISGEDSKHGVSPQDCLDLARSVATLPQLRLRGLMAIPAPAEGIEAQRQAHRHLAALMQALNNQGLQLDTLSMGMSADLEAAVAEGAHWLRIGTALFGARTG